MKRNNSKIPNKCKLNAFDVHCMVMIVIFISLLITGVYVCDRETIAKDPNYTPIEVIYDEFPKSMLKSGEINLYTRIYNDKDTDVEYIVFYSNTGEIEVIPRYNNTFGDITLK